MEIEWMTIDGRTMSVKGKKLLSYIPVLLSDLYLKLQAYTIILTHGTIALVYLN